ncbi:transaldolase family protein, partial [Micrococcus sp. SIMBA_144]
PFKQVDLMMKYKKKMNSNTEVIGASFKDVEQIRKCAEVGIDSITIPAALLEEMFNIEFVERDIENFRSDWAKQHDTNYMDVKK